MVVKLKNCIFVCSAAAQGKWCLWKEEVVCSNPRFTEKDPAAVAAISSPLLHNLVYLRLRHCMIRGCSYFFYLSLLTLCPVSFPPFPPPPFFFFQSHNQCLGSSQHSSDKLSQRGSGYQQLDVPLGSAAAKAPRLSTGGLSRSSSVKRQSSCAWICLYFETRNIILTSVMGSLRKIGQNKIKKLSILPYK